MNKKLLGFAIVLILAAAAAATYFKFGQKDLLPNQQSNSEFKIEKTEPEQGFSQLFPADLYTEPGSTLLQNYEAKTSEGGQQATIITTTQKDLGAVTADYVEYFESKNWLLIESLSRQSNNLALAVLKLGDSRVRITASQNPDTGQKTVEITLTTLQKQN